MRHTFLLIIPLTGFASVATAAPETDFPHRDWGQTATLDMSLSEATACIAREKNRQGGALVIPVEGGNDIDFSAPTGFFGGTVGEPWISYKVRAANGSTTLRVFYRHPMRQGGMTKDVARMQKRCLRVKRVEPSTAPANE